MLSSDNPVECHTTGTATKPDKIQRPPIFRIVGAASVLNQRAGPKEISPASPIPQYCGHAVAVLRIR